jgi:hypothetical protein
MAVDPRRGWKWRFRFPRRNGRSRSERCRERSNNHSTGRAVVISMSRNSPGELPLLGGDLRDLKVVILRLRAQRKGQSRTHRSMRLFLSRDSRTKGLYSHHFIFDLALTNRFTRTRAPYSRSNSSVLSIRVMSGVNIKFEVFLVGPKIQHIKTGCKSQNLYWPIRRYLPC